MLVQIIASSSQSGTQVDPIVLAVAAHDLGQYSKYGAHSKKWVYTQKFLYFCICRILEETGGKTIVMGLMSHENEDVRYQAVAALQKMMMNSW